MFDFTKFCKDFEIMDCLKKLKNQDLDDPEIFFKIDIGIVESTMDIKPEGKKIRVMKKIKELRE